MRLGEHRRHLVRVGAGRTPRWRATTTVPALRAPARRTPPGRGTRHRRSPGRVRSAQNRLGSWRSSLPIGATPWQDDPRVRAAVTLEQCWHAVPGGTAVVGARVGSRPRRPGRRRTRRRRPLVTEIRPLSPGGPRSTSGTCGLPRDAALRAVACPVPLAARVERATGPVDVVHAHGGGFPAADAPLVVTIHDLAFLHDPRLVHDATAFASSGAVPTSLANMPSW